MRRERSRRQPDPEPEKTVSFCLKLFLSTPTFIKQCSIISFEGRMLPHWVSNVSWSWFPGFQEMESSLPQTASSTNQSRLSGLSAVGVLFSP
jgi:hypothetical protein